MQSLALTASLLLWWKVYSRSSMVMGGCQSFLQICLSGYVWSAKDSIMLRWIYSVFIAGSDA